MKTVRVHASPQMLRALGVETLHADFELVECNQCGHQCLVDHERLRVHTDPANLSLGFLNTEEDWQPCPGCGHGDWDFAASAQVSRAWRHLVSFGEADEP
jgi:ribosomal protein S27E